MERRNFIKQSGLWAGVLALFTSRKAIAADESEQIKRLESVRDYFIERHVVMHDILQETLTHKDLEKVYNKFGGNCANRWGAVEKAQAYKGNLDKYLEELPKLDKYQEKAWFDKEKNRVTIIGTKREQCVCSMARTSGNPDWCHLCCAGHQKANFEALLGKQVNVTMGETILLGGERCNHFVEITDNKIDI